MACQCNLNRLPPWDLKTHGTRLICHIFMTFIRLTVKFKRPRCRPEARRLFLYDSANADQTKMLGGDV